MNDPLISVVIPCFNHAHFLSEAIQSVLMQTYPLVEVVVVDDGSSDHTGKVARDYPAARYIRQENQGLAAARNTGLRASSGVYVAFLDADDRLLPDALRAGRQCFDAHPRCAFVFGRFRWIAADGSVLPQTPEQRPRPTDPYQAFLEGNYVAMHATVLYHRDALLAVGGFDPRLRECEDYELYLRLTRSHPIAQHAGLVAEYRQHGGNMSAQAERMLETVLDVLGSQCPYVAGNRGYARSLRKGFGAWRDYYGQALLREVRRLTRERRWNEAVRTLSVLWRLCGSRLPTVALLYLLPAGLRTRLRRLRKPLSAGGGLPGAQLG